MMMMMNSGISYRPPLWNYVLRTYQKFLPRPVNQLISTKVDAECDQLATVVGKLTVLATTDDLGQFITLSVHLCLQHDARVAARRAGPSATADKKVKVAHTRLPSVGFRS